MRLKQTFNILTALLFVNIFSLTNTSTNNDATFNVKVKNANQNESINNNIQKYTKDNGEKRTIHWTKGITAPLMASDSELENAGEGYFRKVALHEANGDYVYYDHPMEDNKGYYDFNKNPHVGGKFPNQVAHHCYLASAMNLIYWWFDQNASYIDKFLTPEYQEYFPQDGNLRKVTQEDWTRYRKVPVMEEVRNEGSGNHKSMELSSNPMYREVFRSFQYRDEGYWPHFVWNSFFNGFYDVKPNEKIHMPASDGGLFYPLFGRNTLSSPFDMGSYEFFSSTVLDALNAGHALSLALNLGKIAHAITIWGAETDETGHVVRIYFTDSDDYHDTEQINGVSRGLLTYDVHKDSKGQPRLTQNINPGPNEGSLVDGVYILRLEQDHLEKVLKDIDAPKAPEIKFDLQDIGYTSAAETPKKLTFEIKKLDDGVHTYQWYVSDDATSAGEKIVGATSASYTPTPIAGKDKYYYCVVTNERRNKKISVTSKRSRIFVSPDAVNVLAPKVSYTLNNGSRKFRYTQYAQPKPLKINVTQFDEGKLSYQWFKKVSTSIYSPTGGTPILGEIYDTYYPKTDEVGAAYDYYCEVTNTNEKANGTKKVVVSPVMILTVEINNSGNLINAMTPQFVKQPESEINYEESLGIPVLQVHANISDNGYLSYQWYKANDETSVGELIPNANQPFYSINNTQESAYYYCKVTNHNASIKGNTTAEVNSNRCKFTGTGGTSLDNNAYLSAISLTNGKLDPIFNKDTLTYNVVLPINIKSTTVTASKASNDASIEGSTQTVTLNNGESKTITIKVTAQDGSTTKTYTINISRASTIKSITVNNTYTYDGEAQELDLTVLNSKDEKLVLNKDYKIEYTSNNTNAGTVNFKVAGLNDYDGVSQSGTFEIKKAKLDQSNITISDSEITYNGEKQVPTVELKFNNKTLTKDVDYEITYPSDNTNAGEKTLTIKGKGNFDFTYTHTYKISKAENSVSISMENGQLTGSATNGEVKYKYYSDKDGKQEISKPSHNGTFYVKGYVEESTNYSYGESALLPFSINNGFESVDIKGSYTYDGNNKDIDLDIYNADGDKLVLNQDYQITYLSDRKNAGIVKVLITGINDYAGVTKEVSFEIKKANNNASIEIVDGEIKGSATNGEITYKYYSDKEGKNEIAKPTTPGTYYVKGVINASENYDYFETDLIEYVVKPSIVEPEIDNNQDNNIQILIYSLTGVSAIIILAGVIALIAANRKKKIK